MVIKTFASSQIWTVYQFMDPLGNSLFGEFAYPRMKKIIDTANVNNINVYLLSFVETQIHTSLFIHKVSNSNSRIISTDEDPSLRIESSAIINLRGVSTKLNKYIVFTMQTYKKLNINVTLLQLVGGLYLLGTHLVDKFWSFFACIT